MGARKKMKLKKQKQLNNIVDKYFARGETHFNAREFEKAIADFTEVIRIDPDGREYNGYLFRGDCYYNNEEYEKAIEDFDKAIQLDPNDITPHINMLVSKQRAILENTYGLCNRNNRLGMLYE